MNEGASATDEDKNRYVAIWAKAVDTQMHFNEMSVKARQFGLGFVAAALGLGVVLITRGQDAALEIPVLYGIKLHATVVIAFASAMSMHAVSLLDLKVYHRMLRGAVSFGEDFEQNYMTRVFDLEKGMTQAISHFSRFDDAAVNKEDGQSYKYTGERLVTAEVKIKRFYRLSIVSLVTLGLALFAITGDIKFDRIFGARRMQTQPPPAAPPVPSAGSTATAPAQAPPASGHSE